MRTFLLVLVLAVNPLAPLVAQQQITKAPLPHELLKQAQRRHAVPPITAVTRKPSNCMPVFWPIIRSTTRLL